MLSFLLSAVSLAASLVVGLIILYVGFWILLIVVVALCKSLADSWIEILLTLSGFASWYCWTHGFPG